MKLEKIPLVKHVVLILLKILISLKNHRRNIFLSDKIPDVLRWVQTRQFYSYVMFYSFEIGRY